MQHIHSPAAPIIRIDDRDVLSFGGCAYLGLGNVPDILSAGQASLGQLGAVAALPNHYGFASPANHAAEEAAKRFFGVESAMYFATGYLFPLIALPALADEYDVVLLDETAHYCLVEGARTAAKDIRTFRHCDAADLARNVEEIAAGGKRFLVATDGAFPTFGRVPPLGRYLEILAPHDAWLIVDESHSFGAVGGLGRGACEHENIIGHAKLIAGGSASKGLGAFGGLAVGGHDAIRKMWQAPAARGAAAGISAGAAMLAKSLDYIRSHPERIAQLRSNCSLMRRNLAALDIECAETPAPIFSFARGTADTMRAIQSQLYDDGIFVTYSNYVGAGPEGVLRIAVFADHVPEQIDRLADALSEYLPSQNAD